jgi:hypothetical protein
MVTGLGSPVASQLIAAAAPTSNASAASSAVKAATTTVAATPTPTTTTTTKQTTHSQAVSVITISSTTAATNVAVAQTSIPLAPFVSPSQGAGSAPAASTPAAVSTTAMPQAGATQAASLGQSLLGQAPSPQLFGAGWIDRIGVAPPQGNDPGAGQAWETPAPAPVTHHAAVAEPDLPVVPPSPWDAALDAYLSGPDSEEAPAVKPTQPPAQPPETEDDEVDLGPDPVWWAGAAVALWGLSELRSRRRDRHRSGGNPLRIQLDAGDDLWR